MATVTQRAIVWNTTAGAKTTGSFTPGAGDLVVAIVGVAGTDTAPTITDNDSSITGWTQVEPSSGLRSHGAAVTGGLRAYVSNEGASGSAMTVTSTPSGDTGGGLAVLSVTNPGAFGASAVRGNGGQADQAAGTPAPVLDATPFTVNPIIIAVMTNTNGSANCAPRTATDPDYTEAYDQGFNTPPSGLEVQFLNSGESSTTLTLGAATPSGFASIGIEIQVKQTVAGEVASEDDSVPGGTVSQPTVVSGGVASESDAAVGGQVQQIYTAGPASETDSVPAGQVQQVYTSDPASESDSVPGGTVEQGEGGQEISGGVASETDLVPAGAVAEVYAAGVAQESDSVPAGKAAQIYTAAPAAETDSVPSGQVAQVYTAAPASESDSVPTGKVLQTYTASPASETNSVPGGTVEQGGAQTILGGVALETNEVPAGQVLQVYVGAAVLELDSVPAGQVAQVYVGGVAATVETVPVGQALQAQVVLGGVAQEADSVPAGVVEGGALARWPATDETERWDATTDGNRWPATIESERW